MAGVGLCRLCEVKAKSDDTLFPFKSAVRHDAPAYNLCTACAFRLTQRHEVVTGDRADVGVSCLRLDLGYVGVYEKLVMHDLAVPAKLLNILSWVAGRVAEAEGKSGLAGLADSGRVASQASVGAANASSCCLVWVESVLANAFSLDELGVAIATSTGLDVSSTAGVTGRVAVHTAYRGDIETWITSAYAALADWSRIGDTGLAASVGVTGGASEVAAGTVASRSTRESAGADT